MTRADGETETLVIGHQRPDLDSIAGAVGYAALLGGGARPARAGHLDEQSEWALRRFGIEAPALVLDVAPTFGRVARRVEPVPPETPLAIVVERVGTSERAVPVVDPASGRPLGLVDARACVRLLGLAGAAIGRPGSPEAIQAGAARAAAPVLGPDGDEGLRAPGFPATERLSDRRTAILKAESDDVLVVDGDGRYLGVASRASILAPPRTRLVLVDHNEIGQAVPGAAEAEIVEVLDHHRLASPATAAPLPFTIDVVGATATLVAERFEARGRALEPGLAGLLLAAIISDTLAFRSPTTTPRDRDAARRLAERAGVRDLDALGEEVLAAGAGLGQRPGDAIVAEDFKEFETPAGRLVVSQAEVKTLHEADGRAEDLGAALERLRERRGASLAALLLTDVVRGRSRLLARGEPRLVARIPYPKATGDGYDAGTVVSRKKQLVPALMAALE